MKEKQMGLFKHWSSDNYDDEKSNVPNLPDASNFKILRNLQIGIYLIVEILYPNCNNYEGRKIMVYKDCDIRKLKKQKLIDPHFSENPRFHSPIARFVPNEFGFQCAQTLVNELIFQELK